MKTWYRWANRLFDMYISWCEFRYYILSYIVYAREHDKDVYRSLIDDTELRAAWTEIDDRFSALIDRIFIRIGKELPAHLKSKGMRVSIGEMKILNNTDRIKEKGFNINGSTQGMNYKHYARLMEEMTKPEYIQAASEFRLRPLAKLPTWPADMKQE